VACPYKYGDETAGSGATDLVSNTTDRYNKKDINNMHQFKDACGTIHRTL
jgi:hypothetical protein